VDGVRNKDVRPCKNAIKSNEARHIRKAGFEKWFISIFPLPVRDGFFLPRFLKKLPIWPYNQIDELLPLRTVNTLKPTWRRAHRALTVGCYKRSFLRLYWSVDSSAAGNQVSNSADGVVTTNDEVGRRGWTSSNTHTPLFLFCPRIGQPHVDTAICHQRHE
jgi:hypothetical protein